MTTAMRHKGFRWAPLYHAMQIAAVESIRDPAPLPKKYLKDEYYGTHFGELRVKVKEMREWARQVARDSDAFFSSDAEYQFQDEDDESPADFYSAIERAICDYQAAIEDFASDSWNFGPGEGFNFTPQFTHPSKLTCERIGKKCCPKYVEYLREKARRGTKQRRSR